MLLKLIWCAWIYHILHFIIQNKIVILPLCSISCYVSWHTRLLVEDIMKCCDCQLDDSPPPETNNKQTRKRGVSFKSTRKGKCRTITTNWWLGVCTQTMNKKYISYTAKVTTIALQTPDWRTCCRVKLVGWSRTLPNLRPWCKLNRAYLTRSIENTDWMWQGIHICGHLHSKKRHIYMEFLLNWCCFLFNCIAFIGHVYSL